MKSKVFLFLFLGIFLNLFLRTYIHREQYLTRYDPQYWQDRYFKSQWVTPNSNESIGDDGLYAYSGWEYIHGADPSLLNAEMPPLGKYLIGATTAVFGSQNIQALLFGLAILIILYHLARLFLSRTLAIFVVYLLSLEPVFADQMHVSLLDLPELAFLISSIFLFLKFLRSEKTIFLILSFIFLGAMMAVKFFTIAFLLGATYFLSLLIFKNKRQLLKLILFSPIAIFTYVLSYAGYFLNGHSFREFLSVQKWIVVFYQDSLAFAFPGGPFWMMLFNRWESWFGGLWYRDHIIISAPGWQVTWPLILLLSLASLGIILKKRDFRKNYLNQIRLVLALWFLIYFLFLSFVPIFPRYLLLAIPFMYVLSADFIFNRDLIKKILPYLKKESEYAKEYIYFLLLAIVFLLWKIAIIDSGNFIFSSDFVRDLTLTRNIIFGLTPLIEPPLVNIVKSLFLSTPYFLADGKTQGLVTAIFLFPLILSFIFFQFFRRRKRFSLLITGVIISFFIILYQWVWGISVVPLGGRSEDLFKNQKEVVDFTYRDSEIYKFSLVPLNKDFNIDSYRFLYQWYETRQYRGRNIQPGDDEMIVLYAIIDPSYKINDSDRKIIATNYKVKFKFDQKFSSGITVWKFDRLSGGEQTVNFKK